MPEAVLTAYKTLNSERQNTVAQFIYFLVEQEEKEETPKKCAYSESLSNFRKKYADFLKDEAETEGLDDVFDSVRDKSESLRATEMQEW